MNEINNRTLNLPLAYVQIVQQKMNHVFQTNVNPIDVHWVDFLCIVHTRNDVTNCNDSHMQILYQILDRNLECCIEHDCYEKNQFFNMITLFFYS